MTGSPLDTWVAEMLEISSPQQSGKAKDQPLGEPTESGESPASVVRPSNSFTGSLNGEVERSIPERFETIARRYPDRLALKMGERSLTYDELNRYANRIARTILDKRGPGGEPIALLFEHGIDIIAAIFGVLKAGKFFVALDPAFPIARMNLIVEDSQARLIVTNNRNWSRARSFSNVIDVMLSVDELDASVVGENLGIAISPATISSIMYTSGSTGTPKGVIETHGNILESSRHLTQRVNLISDDRLTLLHTLTYGSARTNVYLSLLNGGSLFPFDLCSEGPEHLAEWLNRERITILYCPVALFRQFAELHTERSPLSGLRLLHLSGAPITGNDFELYKKHFEDSVLLEISMGSTEARSIAGAVLNKQFTFPSEGNPVGYASPGKTILILDAGHQALPKGEVGEIAVKGRNLNPGYWRMPNLTNERYLLDHPDGGDERIYLTGDLGLMLADGFLIHLGRKDLMIKIRGVDIGEVERVLAEHPMVKDAGVAAWDRDPGEKYLVGYVVPLQEAALNVSELNEFLRNKLPDHMIPSAFMFLESLPLTNGKLNRNALPKPDNRRPDLEVSYVAPRNDVEKKLSQVWGEVLSLDQMGIHDDFFDLGGHSLAGAGIITRVKELFGVEFPVSDLLASPTVAQLSEIINHRQNDKTTVQPLLHVQPTTPLTGFSKEEVEQSIPERFEKIVRLYPDRIAVKAGNQVVTYSELNAMANRVAHSIVSRRGTEPEPVGLLVEKGVEQIAAMLGILKAGKFFVPLDSSYPLERMSSILQDSQTVSLIVDRQTDSIAQQIAACCQLIRFDAMHQGNPAGDLKRSISPHALACVVYTSGSTGKPKGVIRNHRALLHSAMLRVHTDGIASDDRLAHITAGTSNAVTNAFYALLQGAALVTFEFKQEGVARLAGWLVDEKITICLIASPVFRKLCAALTGTERFPDLRYLRLRSDTVYKSDVELHSKYFPSTCSLASGLASSETGPVREYQIYHDTEFDGSEAPIGYALQDKEVFLLNDDGQTVGFNEVGEIVVRSDYLSLGYWNNPELTAKKFKPCPRDPRKRLYYTDDLGLMLPDGCLVHKGRKDFRVKIRGYGVDLIEVETSLRRHPGVEDAVVVASWSKTGEMRLIGYFTSSTERIPSVNELRGFLQKTLADYMIPSVFMKMENIPLTSNGKVDRKALPAPDNSRPELDTPFVDPMTMVERELASIWAEILSVQEVGIHDSFFDLGGHSLAAMRVVSQVIQKFQLELPLQSLFQSPTVAAMAAVIREHQEKRLGKEEMERLLGEIEALSDEQARRLLAEDARSKSEREHHD